MNTPTLARENPQSKDGLRGETSSPSPGDGEWVFTWTKGLYGWLEREEQGWVLDGRPNAVPDTEWVIAHDVFHHLPGDTGTYREEVMTFGAETWMMGPDVDMREAMKTINTSWNSVMVLVMENGSRGVEGLLLNRRDLKQAPMEGDTDIEPLRNMWIQAYGTAIGELREFFPEMATTELWDRLSSDENMALAVALVEHGYRRAQARWPDVAAAKAMFKRIEKAAGQANEGDRLVVKIEGERLQIDRQAALAVSAVPRASSMRP